MVAGTPAGDDPSVNSNRELPAQYQKEVSVSRTLRYKHAGSGHCPERDAPRQLNRQVFITNEGLRSEHFDQAQLSIRASESVKQCLHDLVPPYGVCHCQAQSEPWPQQRINKRRCFTLVSHTQLVRHETCRAEAYTDQTLSLPAPLTALPIALLVLQFGISKVR